MHGLILEGLRAYASRRLGEPTAARLWDGHAYEAGETYPDTDFLARFGELRAATEESNDSLLHDFGIFTASTTFVGLYPDYYAANTGTIPFLLGIEERIHTVVRATLHGARPPKLQVRALGDEGALVSYTSERRLCRLLAGLVDGVAGHYGETISVEEIQCMHRGDPGCVFAVLRAAA